MSIILMMVWVCLQGRQRKGSIFVFAGGNGDRTNDTSANEPFANLPYTIVINGVTYDNRPPDFAKECACVLASAFTAGLDDRRVSSYNYITFTNPA